MAIVDDFKAIREACDNISREIMGKKEKARPWCVTCNDEGAVFVPDPRIGYPDKRVLCPDCGPTRIEEAVENDAPIPQAPGRGIGRVKKF